MEPLSRSSLLSGERQPRRFDFYRNERTELVDKRLRDKSEPNIFVSKHLVFNREKATDKLRFNEFEDFNVKGLPKTRYAVNERNELIIEIGGKRRPFNEQTIRALFEERRPEDEDFYKVIYEMSAKHAARWSDSPFISGWKRDRSGAFDKYDRTSYLLRVEIPRESFTNPRPSGIEPEELLIGLVSKADSKIHIVRRPKEESNYRSISHGKKGARVVSVDQKVSSKRFVFGKTPVSGLILQNNRTASVAKDNASQKEAIVIRKPVGESNPQKKASRSISVAPGDANQKRVVILKKSVQPVPKEKAIRSVSVNRGAIKKAVDQPVLLEKAIGVLSMNRGFTKPKGYILRSNRRLSEHITSGIIGPRRIGVLTTRDKYE